MIEVRGATVARDTLASAPHEADGAFERMPLLAAAPSLIAVRRLTALMRTRMRLKLRAPCSPTSPFLFRPASLLPCGRKRAPASPRLLTLYAARSWLSPAWSR